MALGGIPLVLIATTLGIQPLVVAISTSGIFLAYLLKPWFNLYVTLWKHQKLLKGQVVSQRLHSSATYENSYPIQQERAID